MKYTNQKVWKTIIIVFLFIGSFWSEITGALTMAVIGIMVASYTGKKFLQHTRHDYAAILFMVLCLIVGTTLGIYYQSLYDSPAFFVIGPLCIFSLGSIIFYPLSYLMVWVINKASGKSLKINERRNSTDMPLFAPILLTCITIVNAVSAGFNSIVPSLIYFFFLAIAFYSGKRGIGSDVFPFAA